jgi:hypothetical protein
MILWEHCRYAGDCMNVEASVAYRWLCNCIRISAADISGIRRNFFQGGSTNSVQGKGQKEWESGGGSPLVRGSAQFANE